MPQLYMIIPVEGGLDEAAHDRTKSFLPAVRASIPSQPIDHPGSWGGPVDPGWGQGGGASRQSRFAWWAGRTTR